MHTHARTRSFSRRSHMHTLKHTRTLTITERDRVYRAIRCIDEDASIKENPQ